MFTEHLGIYLPKTIILGNLISKNYGSIKVNQFTKCTLQQDTSNSTEILYLTYVEVAFSDYGKPFYNYKKEFRLLFAYLGTK